MAKKKKVIKTIVLLLMSIRRGVAQTRAISKGKKSNNAHNGAHATQHLVLGWQKVAQQPNQALAQNATIMLQKMSKPNLSWSYRASQNLSPQAKIHLKLVQGQKTKIAD